MSVAPAIAGGAVCSGGQQKCAIGLRIATTKIRSSMNTLYSGDELKIPLHESSVAKVI